MTKLYSPTTQGFYCRIVHKSIPEDAIEISDYDYKVLLIGQSKGQTIIVTDDRPSLQGRSIESTRKTALASLENALHNFVFKEHGYPIPTQATIQAICNDPDVPDTTRAKARSVVKWINSTVLVYYYTIKAEIQGSDSPDDVSFDFARACGADAPFVRLVDLII